jgi:MSHA biogenesis protein MshO
MQATSHRQAPQRGFTLIELVMVIVIMGVIGGVVSVFMRSPIDAYFASVRRAALTDVADGTLRRMARDVRKALPNSLRTPTPITAPATPANQCLEFIPTKTGGRYRADNTGAGLSFDAPDGLFNMLGENGVLPADQRIVAGDLIAVYNLGIAGADAYNQDNTRVVSAVGAEFQNASLGWETPINLTATLSPYPLASGSNRFHVIPSAERVVSYVCRGNTLFRTVSNVNFTSNCAATGAVLAATGAVLATNVSNCFFDYGGADLSRNAMVRIVLQLQDSTGTESVRLQQEIHVNNTP